MGLSRREIVPLLDQILSQRGIPPTSLGRAIWATLQSVESTYGKEESRIPIPCQSKKVEEILKKRKLPKALAMIGHEVQGVLRQWDRTYKLGIILPGGSQIFWPEGRFKNGNVKLILIKANVIISKRDLGYRFDPVTQGPRFEELANRVRRRAMMNLKMRI